MKHAWLCIDPGITTGWALLDDNGKVVGTSVWGTAELKVSLDTLIRACYTAGTTLDVIVEAMPSTGKMGALAQKLERVRHDIMDTVADVYEIPTTYVMPGTWKPSRVARTTKIPDRWKGERLMTHQRDAIKIGRYVLDRMALTSWKGHNT